MQKSFACTQVSVHFIAVNICLGLTSEKDSKSEKTE